MSGFLNVLAAGGNSESMIVTVATSSGSGYVDGLMGSISPGTYRGKSITIVRSTGGVDLQIAIDDASDLPQDFFTRLTIEDGAGVTRTYASADATFVSGGIGGENWNFGDGNERVFDSGDDTEEHRITFYL